MQIRVNEPDVVFEAFDEEVVLVNLETGNYYSLRGSGPRVWMALSSGIPVEALAGSIAAETGTQAHSIEAEIASFVGELLDAAIVVEAQRDAPATPAWEGPFEAPNLETYTDMQDLLLLDPVHDVDSTGWPKAKEA